MDDQDNQENSDLITQSGSNINEDSLKSNLLKLNNDDNDVSSESILSSINEECNRISSEHENNDKGDSEQLDALSNQMDFENSRPERSDAKSLKDNEVDAESLKDNEDAESLKDNEVDAESLKDNEVDADADDNMDTEPSVNPNEIDVDKASDSKENSEHVKGSEVEEKIEPDKIPDSNEVTETDNDTTKMPNTGEETNSNSGSNDLLMDEGSKSEESSLDNKKLNENGVSDSEKNGSSGKLKIKLRSFASLCKDDQTNDNSGSENSNQPGVVSNFEVTGVAVGDIVQHNNFVESDECGVMHLKISNVVGGEDSITGLSIDEPGDALANIQISSITSLIEPISPESFEKTTLAVIPEDTNNRHEFDDQDNSKEITVEKENDREINETTERSGDIIVNIFKCSLVVPHACYYCKKRVVCDFRIVFKKNSENEVSFLCSARCKSKAVSSFDESHVVQKPRLFFERVCGNCGKDIANEPKLKILSWQTREFCNKLCLADHIGEVARVCFFCKSSVRVLYMVKYCVRFGSDVHQFCCNTCLETYKTTIKVCSFCQKNLTLVNKVVSPSNKEYCSSKCLKRAQRRDIGQVNYKEENNCTVCMKAVVNEYEFLYNNAVTFLCSSPCLNVFKYVNKVKSVNCCLCSRLLNAEDTSNYFFNGKMLRVFCSESCFSVFVISARKIVTCHYCKVKKYNFDMICSESEGDGEYFSCSVCCLNLAETQLSKTTTNRDSSTITETNSSLINSTVEPKSNEVEGASNDSTQGSSTPLTKNCSMCTKLEPAQFHMVMSDSTLRSFCSYVCATRYKCTFGFQVSGNIQESKKQDGEITNPSILSKILTNADSQTSLPPSKTSTKHDIKDVKTLMKLFCPPHLSNKSTMCRPLQTTKGVQCKPHQWHKTSQTDEDTSVTEGKAIIPVPIPVYVPTPMMMYSSPTPVPLIIPVPVPIPVFIPTLEKTTEELEEKIKALHKAFLENTKKVEATETTEDAEENLVNSEKQTEEEKKALEEKDESETEAILNLQHILPKFNIGSSQKEVLNSENLKRKLEPDSFSSSPKRRKLDDDEADDENEEEEVLNVMLGLSVWQSWTRKKSIEDQEGNCHLKQDLCSMECDILGQSLIQFLSDLSTQSSQFDADTIFFILLGLQKYLFEKGSSHCIFLELNFDSFTSVFDEMVENFFQRVSKPSTKCLQATRVTEEMMWEARQLGAHTPHVLINTLFYFNTKIFRLKDAAEHFKLSFTEISRETIRTSVSPDGTPVLTSYLKYSKEIEDESDSSNNLLMYENKENPLRCPVKLYEFYLSKCPENIQDGKDKYYVYPEETCMPDSPVWYTSEAIEESTISKMLNRIFLVKEIQENLFGQ